MGRGLVCDNCGAVLKLKANGDDEYGEVAAWLKVTAGGETWDACTRSCLHELIDKQVAPVVEAAQEVVAEVLRAIHESDEDEVL